MNSTFARLLAAGALACFLTLSSAQARAGAQEQTPQHGQDKSKDNSIGAELARETREAAGEEEEEHAELKHSSLIRKLAQKTGLSVHQAHLLATSVNFAIIVVVIYWLARKSVPAAMRRRTESIQRALQQARAASEDASRRLRDIEERLQKLDSEVGQMQAAAERDGAEEETRIKAATEDDIRKVVQAAEQEIAAAAKQARRELLAHTAELAVTLARKQIEMNPAADQVLVRDFASNLTAEDGGKRSS